MWVATSTSTTTNGVPGLLARPALRAILLLASVVVGPIAADALAVAPVEEENWAAISALTPEQALRLVAKRTDTTVRIDTDTAALALAGRGISFRDAIVLGSLKTLDAETAAVLARYADGPLFLDGLSELPDAVAAELKQLKGGLSRNAFLGSCLSLAGLETLSPEAAAELAAFRGEALVIGARELSEPAFRNLMRFQRRLYLPRLAQIPAGAAESLADYRGPRLSILGLVTLSPKQAQLLAGLGNRWNGRLPNLRNLSPEAAAVLADFATIRLELDASTLSDEAIRELIRFSGSLLLRGLSEPTLSDSKLASLAEFRGSGLGLGGLTRLPPELATRMARTFESRALYLDEVAELSPEAASALVGFPGQISLDGLTELTPELARALGNPRKLSLRGVTSLSAEAAAALLANFPGGDLTLSLTTLSLETAKVLAKGDYNSLFLQRLTAISDEAAAALGELRCTNLWLSGLTELSPEAAKGLASIQGRVLGPTLRLEGVRQLAPEAARALTASDITYLELTGLRTLSAGTAEALARSPAFNGSLPQLTTLTADAAVALASFAGNGRRDAKLSLLGLMSLDPETARGLAAFRGNLELDGLTEIDAETAAQLATYAGPGLSLQGLQTLPADAAEQLAKAVGWDGRLTSLRSLSDEAAVALAGFEGRGLSIPAAQLSDRAVQALAGFRGSNLLLNLPRISDRSAQALVDFDGEKLSLVGLQEPSDELARLLPSFKCQLLSLHPWEFNLGRREPVTPADARLLAAYAERFLGRTVVLPGIVSFETADSIRIATILSESQGSFAIPNLRRLSAKTLAALLAKGNVTLLAFEERFSGKLTLIAEPDGSSGDASSVPLQK